MSELQTTIGFPGLGIPDFHLDRYFTIPFINFDVYWYGVIIVTGMIIAVIYALKNCKRFNLTQDNIYDIAIYGSIGGFICARLYYVLFEIENYHSFWQVINLRDGGLAIYGGIIGAAIALAIYSKIKKVKLLDMFDIGSLGLLIGQCIGRWGNFVNMEAFGYSTDLPWRMKLVSNKFPGLNGEWAYDEVHPTFLYESLWNLIGFIIISKLSKKKQYSGQVFLMYGAWYGLGRGLIEGLRTDSLVLFNNENLRVSQIIGYITFVIFTFILIFIYFKNKKIKDNDVQSHESIFETPKETTENNNETEHVETISLQDNEKILNSVGEKKL